MFLPKRAYLDQVRIAEQARSTLELSLRQRALVWARHLAQARGTRLSEIAWGLWLVAAVFSPGERLCFLARRQLAQARRNSPKRESRFQQPSLLVFLPKRGPAVWAKEPFRLSEANACIGVIFVVLYMLTGDLLHDFITLFKAWMN